MDEKRNKKTGHPVILPAIQPGNVCCAEKPCCDPAEAEAGSKPAETRVLNIDLVVIDLSVCARCVPTGDQLQKAVRLLAPVAEALGIEFKYRAIIVQSAEEARQHALLSSPTIRINGRDIAQDIRESVCESCGDLTENNTLVDCREWHYAGRVYASAPLPLLLEAIMGSMLNIDEEPPTHPAPLEELPENLKKYFDNKKLGGNSCCD